MKTQKQSLENLAMSLTIENIVKKPKLKSVNHRIIEVLKDGSKLDRRELVNKITVIRLEHEIGLTKLSNFLKNPKAKENEELLKKFFKVSRTVKNGVDTSIAKGHTNANFSFNPEFKNWDLKVDSQKRYYLVSVK